MQRLEKHTGFLTPLSIADVRVHADERRADPDAAIGISKRYCLRALLREASVERGNVGCWLAR